MKRISQRAVAELLVGVRADPQFGQVLVVGAGGVLVELLDDIATLLLPVDHAEVRQALTGFKGGGLVEPAHRGRPAADPEMVVSAIMALAQFAVANADELIELDVNPLIVTPSCALAADALMVVRD